MKLLRYLDLPSRVIPGLRAIPKRADLLTSLSDRFEGLYLPAGMTTRPAPFKAFVNPSFSARYPVTFAGVSM